MTVDDLQAAIDALTAERRRVLSDAYTRAAEIDRRIGELLRKREPDRPFICGEGAC